MTCVFDYSKIISDVYAKGLTYSDVARSLGISELAYSMKMSNKAEFTQKEIDTLAIDILRIPPERIPEYFFTPVV
ncbi:DUF739 family protein [Anaerovorax odorimutans]|uniref:DUF739 family protein n=1 Tax=Anaerovorax odorimutans TaxID=109327 RepID=A0ABT1RU38_9FIRM|nr:DUF739 family protein [Anaerovorax odorimutans]MCQ4638351.1 DUF739 family protein [Anaerovorax odorimutans]